MSEFTFTEAPPGEQKTQPSRAALLPAPRGQGFSEQIGSWGWTQHHVKGWGMVPVVGQGAGVHMSTHPARCRCPMPTVPPLAHGKHGSGVSMKRYRHQ